MTDQMTSIPPAERVTALSRVREIVTSSPLVFIAAVILAIIVLRRSLLLGWSRMTLCA